MTMMMFRPFARRMLHTTSRNVAFAFDIDGVLIRGSKVIPQAPAALQLLNRTNIPYILLTNGGGKSEADRVAELTKKLGDDLPISESQFLQSHTPFQQLANRYKSVYVVGGDGDRCRNVAKSYGFDKVVMSPDVVSQVGSGISPHHRFQQWELDQWTDPAAMDVMKEPIDAVLVFNDPRDMGTDLQIVMDLLLSQQGQLGTWRQHQSSTPAIPIHFSNNDLLWANNYHLPRFGQGAFRIIVERLYKEMTGCDLQRTIIGKPFHATYQYADNLLQSWAKSASPPTVYMVGDNPASDIEGANAYGWQSMLLRSGVYKDGDKLSDAQQPGYIYDNVLDAVESVVHNS